MAYAIGEDRSNYQAIGSWSQNAFGLCKATEGTGFVDGTFEQNWANLKSEGKVRGAYHFFHPAISPTAQAQFFFDVVKARGGWEPGDIAMADVEIMMGADGTETAPIPAVARMHVPFQTLPVIGPTCRHETLASAVTAASGAAQWCLTDRQACGGMASSAGKGTPIVCAGCAQARALAAASTSVGSLALEFLNAVASRVGAHCPVIIYSDLFMATTALGACAGYPLFVADYSGSPPPSVHPWTTWLIWQHADHGAQGGGDADYFNGNDAQLATWHARYTGVNPPPPPPPPTPLPAWQTALVAALPQVASPETDVAGGIPWVKQVQLLADITGTEQIAADGIFGPATEAAVKAIQAAHSLTQDGIVGPNTWSCLAFGDVLGVLPTLAEGAQDQPGGFQDVHRIQALCGCHGVPLTMDGAFGPATTDAVKVIQQSYQETADGIVGPITWHLLYCHARP